MLGPLSSQADSDGFCGFILGHISVIRQIMKTVDRLQCLQYASMKLKRFWRRCVLLATLASLYLHMHADIVELICHRKAVCRLLSKYHNEH